jgi:drug/metabolite transporter (DMT)-like permease
MNDKQRGVVLSLLSSSMGISPVLFRLSMDAISPEMTNLLQTFFASILFALLFLIFRKSIDVKTMIRNWRGPFMIAFFVFIGGLLYTYGILFSGPTTATFVIQYATVFTVILGVVLLKERFTKTESSGIILAIIGLLMISYKSVDIQLFSLAVLLFGALSFALSNIISKVYVENIDPVTLAGGRSLFIFLFFLVYSLLTNKASVDVPIITLGYLFLAAITGVFLNFILFFKSLELIEVSRSTAITSIGPLFTAVYSFIFLSLIPAPNELLGGILIVIGIITLSLTREQHTAQRDLQSAPLEPEH